MTDKLPELSPIDLSMFSHHHYDPNYMGNGAKDRGWRIMSGNVKAFPGVADAGGISSVYYNRNNLLVWSIGVALVLIGSFGVILGTFWISITFAENASSVFWIFLGSAVFWCGGSFVLAELLWRCWGV